MRNKVSNSLFKRGLISFAAAGLLATGAMGAVNISTTTAGYTYNVSKTVATKGDKIYVVVTLLDENGKVDTLSGGNSTPKITLTSLNGIVCRGKSPSGCVTGSTTAASYNQDTTTTSDDFTNGVGIYTVDYTSAKIGKDTLKFGGTVTGTNLDTGAAGYSTILDSKSVDITVNEAPNDAVTLGVSAIVPVTTSNTSSSKTESRFSTVENNASVDAGDGFKITLKAYKKNGSAQPTAETDFTENQNGAVSVKFIYDAFKDKDLTNDYGEVSLVKEVTGTMVNGVAEIDVPAETLTKAGSWAIYASAETSIKTSDSDYYAETTDANFSAGTKYLTISPLTATDFTVVTERPFIMAYTNSGTNGQNALTITTVDKYGNAASVASTVKFKAEATNYIFDGSAKSKSDITIASNSSSADYNITGYSATPSDAGVSFTGVTTSNTKTTNTITVTPTSGASWAAKTVNLDSYYYGIVVGLGDMNVSSFAPTSEGNYTCNYKKWNSWGNFAAGTTPTTTNVEGNATKIFITNRFTTNVQTLIQNPSAEITGSFEANATWVDTASAPTSTTVSTVNSDGFLFDEKISSAFGTAPKFKLTLKNSAGTTSEFSGAGFDFLSRNYGTADGNTSNSTSLVKASFSKSISNARIVAELDVSGKYAAPYDYDNFKASKSISFTNADANVTAASIKTVGIGTYSNTSSEAKLLGKSLSFTEASSLVVKSSSISDSNRAPLTIWADTNASSAYGLTNSYVMRFKDTYGNYAKNTAGDNNITISTTDVSGELTPVAVEFNTTTATSTTSDSARGCSAITGTGVSAGCFAPDTNSGNSDMNISIKYKQTGNDTLTFSPKGWGTSSLTLPVTISDIATNLKSITLSSVSDYVLKNSTTTINIEALNKDATAYDFSGPTGATNTFTYLISNPNLVTVTEGNSTTASAKTNGADINDSTSSITDGKTVLFIEAKNTVGTPIVTIKNKSGSVVATKTLNIVETSADLPSPINAISTSVTNVSVVNTQTVDVTVTVTKENGETAANETITVSSDNTNVVTVPATITTDDNGEATLTITAGTIVSSANVTLTIGGISEVVSVNVTAAPEMTVGSTAETIIAGAQATILVANAADTVSATSSDTAVATTGVDGSDVIITGVAEGTATITVTDGTTTKTIAVTVEKGATPAMTPAIMVGWNLLGNASNDSVDPTSFAGAGETVWTYTMVAGWTELTTIAPMQGFWYKARTAMADGLEFPMTGDGTGEVTFTAGEWSLMTPSEAMTLGDIKTAKGASEGWTFMDGAWSSDDATSVEQGRGYWIK